MAQEPVLTWNLFVTILLVPLSVMILYGAIVRFFKKRDKKEAINKEEQDKKDAANKEEQDRKDEKIRKLQDEKEVMKQAAISERYDDLKKTLCSVKDKIEAIGKEQQERVTWAHCEKEHAEVRNELKDIHEKLPCAHG